MMRRTFTVLAAALVVVAAGCADPAPSAVRASAAVTSTAPLVTSDVTAAEVVSPDPRVGAVFLDGQSLHVCSGAVLDSPAGDLILTAAHCVADGMEAYFVPGFAGKADPADYWRLDAVYLDPRWLYTQDPLADFAIARVSRASGGSVQAQV